ncbi:unnamed protein product [Adineta steineri]|uniref:Uncharacterized protein n=1 Tax=Adineta steineri TaxID=433720 RepID=A0A813N0Y0_9BILA|nr:unnamed protein product [Adineta steineri]
MTTIETKREKDESIYIDLDLKCSCPQSKLNTNASIQFSRRYLQCQSSMPIAILRSYIQQILPHSSITQVSFYDSNDRLLQDSHLLSSLKSSTTSSSSLHIPIRFTLFNTITSLAHCSCSSPSSTPFIQQQQQSCSPTIIQRQTIDQTLSTCSLIQTISSSTYSPCLSSSSPDESLPTSSNSISIVNLLTPPPTSSSSPPSSHSSHSSFMIETLVDSNNLMNDERIINEITSQFGEICPPLPKKSRNRLSKKVISTYPSNAPLDLSIKKRPSSSSFTLFSSQPKWIKT